MAAKCAAFTLVELLVVIAVIGLLAALLVPAAGRSLAAGARGRCSGNLQQLFLANSLRAEDAGFYAPAAADMFTKNLQRWHGTRTSKTQAFNGGGPLAAYLGGDRLVRACPSLRDVAPGFEKGCGGYGYNAMGVGSQYFLVGYNQDGATNGMAPAQVAQPGATIMFTDAAFLDRTGLIEYSFAEPFIFIGDSLPIQTTERARPTIHFRHNERAGVAWTDGHVSWESLAHSYSEAHAAVRLGWFGGPDNGLFDPF